MERHFSEQQVSEIIRRAADKQSRRHPAGEQAKSGVSESELLRVAKELGIDQESLQLAMTEVSSGGLEDTGALNSFSRVLERSVDGELSAEQLGIVLEEFTPMEGIGSSVVSHGKTLSYNSLVGLSQCNINVATRDGKTSLRVKSNAFLSYLLTFVPALMLTLITNLVIWEEIRPAALDDGLVPAILIPMALFTAAYFASKKLIQYSNRKVLELTNRTTAKFEESADHLRSRISKSGIPLPEVESDVETRLQ